jgi:hypothetical protein
LLFKIHFYSFSKHITLDRINRNTWIHNTNNDDRYIGYAKVSLFVAYGSTFAYGITTFFSKSPHMTSAQPVHKTAKRSRKQNEERELIRLYYKFEK